MNWLNVLLLAAGFSGMPAVPGPSEAGEMRLYQGSEFAGRETLIDDGARPNVHAGGTVRSVSIHPGDWWEVCSQPSFERRCAILERSVADSRTNVPPVFVRSAGQIKD